MILSVRLHFYVFLFLHLDAGGGREKRGEQWAREMGRGRGKVEKADWTLYADEGFLCSEETGAFPGAETGWEVRVMTERGMGYTLAMGARGELPARGEGSCDVFMVDLGGEETRRTGMLCQFEYTVTGIMAWHT